MTLPLHVECLRLAANDQWLTLARQGGAELASLGPSALALAALRSLGEEPPPGRAGMLLAGVSTPARDGPDAIEALRAAVEAIPPERVPMVARWAMGLLERLDTREAA